MRDRVARWRESGHSARVFAEQEGVSAGTLYSWSRRLGMKRSEYRQRSEKAALHTLLPVVVGPSGTTASSPDTMSPLDDACRKFVQGQPGNIRIWLAKNVSISETMLSYCS